MKVRYFFFRFTPRNRHRRASKTWYDQGNVGFAVVASLSLQILLVRVLAQMLEAEKRRYGASEKIKDEGGDYVF